MQAFQQVHKYPEKEREQEESKENYPWLDPSDERKYMTDKEILDRYIDLDKYV